MRIFVTGATGYIGRVVVQKAIAAGHNVYGLSRSDEGDARLEALGSNIASGDLGNLDVLEEQARLADAVLHLAYIHDFTLPYEKVLAADAAAVNAMARGMHLTEKALVATSGTAVVEPDPYGDETPEEAPTSKTFILKDRINSERYALSKVNEGVKVSVIRLPPYVYGRGGSHFVPMLLEAAAKAGESIYVGDGSIRTSTVEVDDAADLFLLAAEKAEKGSVFNGVGSTSVTLRALAIAIGEALHVPARSVTLDEARTIWGEFLTSFVQFDNRASSRKAILELGWKPMGTDILTDIRTGSYVPLVARLREKVPAEQ
jgi:nucleoside-diphosphate-sugar epimerase